MSKRHIVEFIDGFGTQSRMVLDKEDMNIMEQQVSMDFEEDIADV